LAQILVISRYFPPLGSAGGSLRLVKTMKFASPKGWSFTVLTQDLQRTVIPEKEECVFLLDEIPASTKIIRVKAPFTGNNQWDKLLQQIIKDSSIPWGIEMVKKGITEIKKNKPDLIFVNSPPFTNVGIALLLSMRFRIPMILDLKDDWVGSARFLTKNKLRRIFEKGFERITIHKCAAVFTPTAQSYDSIKQRYPEVERTPKFFLIPNGVDLEEYSRVSKKDKKTNATRFRIVSGAAGYRPDYRDLSPFIRALNTFLITNPKACDSLELEFLGEEPVEEYKQELAKLLPEYKVYYPGSVHRLKFIEKLHGADLFFLVQPKNNYSAVSGTLYEYWAIGNAPTLLFSEKGASSDLVQSNHLGMHFEFDEIDAAAAYIQEVFGAKREGNPIKIDNSSVKVFDRSTLTDYMVKIWEDILQESRRH
jgi:glycosyltransferase involved in cell wall biosynthesis